MNLKSIIAKFKDVIPYLFFGVCTTGVNVLSFWIANQVLNVDVMVSTAMAWFLAVAFAYVTNRKWVFHSEIRTRIGLIREVVAFFSCRIGTGLLDFVCMYMFAVVLSCNATIVKFLSDVFVIILNYLASKFYIFNRK